ncbi:MAG: S8 family serine peptidase [Candidatus Dormiibacterota bacterium]
MRSLSLLTWNDKRRTRLLMSGLLAAAAATASATAAGAAGAHFGGATIRVIVRAVPGDLPAADRDIAAVGGDVVLQIPLITASVADVPQAAVAWLSAEPEIAAVTPDGQVRLLSSSYSPTTDPGSLYTVEQELGVTQAWEDGYTGAGVGVALIDTGVSPVEGLDGPGQVVNGPDISFDAASPSLRYLDENGHGTFMAGIIAGRDPGAGGGGGYSGSAASAFSSSGLGTSGDGPAYAADTTDFLGIAPDARIVNVKVASANGAVDVSQVLAAIDWVVQNSNDGGLNIRVLNLSFGTDSTQSYLVDPLAYAAEQAWQQGIVVVAAVGNQGVNAAGVADPADDPYVLAVGASEPGLSGSGGFAVAPFSSHGNSSRSPDLIAPGKSIVSLADPGSVIADQFAATGAVGTRFFRGSGTSEATAVVSGLAALLVQEYPSATPDQIKALMTSTALPLSGAGRRAAGHGEVIASAAIQASLSSTPQSFTPSSGTGSLDGSRGSLHVSLLGITLSGNQDIFGDTVSTATLASQESQADSWSGGAWNGATWSGRGWTSSGGALSWAYAPWSAGSWAGVPWSAVTIDFGTWSGVSWSGVSWSGVSWSGVSWSGVSWSGVSWSDAAWASSSWS